MSNESAYIDGECSGVHGARLCAGRLLKKPSEDISDEAAMCSEGLDDSEEEVDCSPDFRPFQDAQGLPEQAKMTGDASRNVS